MPQTEWWQDAFGTPNGDLSVARLHLAWGVLVLAWYVVLLLCARADAGPPSAMFVSGLIIVLVGGIALLFETRIERLPDLASWPASVAPQPVAPSPRASPSMAPAPLAAQNGATKQARYWLDIAVLQLVFGAGVIPALSGLHALNVVGWRMVTITIVSELVYLAFLGAQLAQTNELNALVAAIEETKKRIASLVFDLAAPAGEAPAVPETEDEKLKLRAEEKRKSQAEEAILKLQAEQEKLKSLQRRAEILMRRFERTFTPATQSS